MNNLFTTITILVLSFSFNFSGKVASEIVKHSTQKNTYKFLFTRQLSKDTIRNKKKYEPKYFVPLKLWVYCRKDFNKQQKYLEIKEMINDLNFYNLLNQTGIYYYLNSDITFFTKKRHVKMNYYVEAPIQTCIHRTKKHLNVYVIDQLFRTRFLRKPVSLRGTFNQITKGVFVVNQSSKTSLAHEIGHYWGLYHPFRNFKKGKRKQESVDRSRKIHGIFRHGLNCELNGDKLCDTPAEPVLQGLMNNTCKYVGNKKDRWGTPYSPNTNNIMSYPSDYTCRNEFTPGQIDRMLASISKKKYSNWITKSSENTLRFDQYEPNNLQFMAGEIVPNAPQEHSFSSVQDIDWLKFLNVSNSGNYHIALHSTNPNIKLTVYTEIGNEIKVEKENSISEENIYKIKNITNGWYYLKIQRNNDESNTTSFDYQVLLTIKR